MPGDGIFPDAGADMDDAFTWIWSLAIIAGPIALGLGLAYGMRRRASAGPQAARRSDEAIRAGRGPGESLRKRTAQPGPKGPPRSPRALR